MLVPAKKHRRALRQQKRRQQITLAQLSRGADRGIVGRSLDAEIVRVVVARSVAIVLAIGQVALHRVADEVFQREAVMRGQEVDRACGRAARMIEQFR
jgi:hypothetical protein